jgi:phosphate/sulfate permease
VLVAALIAVGWIARTPIKRKQIRDIIISWLITLPISAALGILLFALLPTLG